MITDKAPAVDVTTRDLEDHLLCEPDTHETTRYRSIHLNGPVGERNRQQRQIEIDQTINEVVEGLISTPAHDDSESICEVNMEEVNDDSTAPWFPGSSNAADQIENYQGMCMFNFSILKKKVIF